MKMSAVNTLFLSILGKRP